MHCVVRLRSLPNKSGNKWKVNDASCDALVSAASHGKDDQDTCAVEELVLGRQHRATHKGEFYAPVEAAIVRIPDASGQASAAFLSKPVQQVRRGGSVVDFEDALFFTHIESEDAEVMSRDFHLRSPERPVEQHLAYRLEAILLERLARWAPV